MNGTDGIRTQEECLFSDAKRAHSPRRSVSLQRFFRKRCAKYHEIRFACVRSCRRTARTSTEDGPTKDGEGRTPSPPYRILCLRTETHADIAHDDGIKAHVCRCMRRIGIATARRPLLRIHRRKGTKRGRVVKTLPRIVLRRDGERRSPLFENLVGHLTALHGPGISHLDVDRHVDILLQREVVEIREGDPTGRLVDSYTSPSAAEASNPLSA